MDWMIDLNRTVNGHERHAGWRVRKVSYTKRTWAQVEKKMMDLLLVRLHEGEQCRLLALAQHHHVLLQLRRRHKRFLFLLFFTLVVVVLIAFTSSSLPPPSPFSCFLFSSPLLLFEAARRESVHADILGVLAHGEPSRRAPTVCVALNSSVADATPATTTKKRKRDWGKWRGWL